MDSTRWERVQELFHQAADRPAVERRAFLETATGGDQQMVATVLGMLEEDSGGASLLDHDVAQVASQMVGPASAASLPFQDFGPYKLQGVLGEGGMGVVYLARREDLGSLVAIKLLRDAWLSPARRERFASEQRMLAQLNHPSIARLYDANTLADGTPWFVMEYVDGVPLTEYCSQRNCSIEERLKLFRAVSEAVEYAHGHAVIHRDLKPSNILVKQDGTVRLLDFGIAKQLEGFDRPVDQTRTGMHLMTPAYAAPEQIRGERAGVHTDVYSLGVILYEMLTGRLPFDISHKSAAEAAEILTTQEPVKPSALARQTGTRTASWTDLDVLCLTAMHKDPKRRYQSAAALIRDVDHYLKHEPLEARPDSVGYKLGKFVRRNWQAVSAVAAMLSVAAIAAALALNLSSRTSPLKPRSRTIAVLPFRNIGFDHSIDFLGLALPDEIVHMLGYARSLSVRPLEVSSKYSERDVDPQRAGREMGVTNILRGHFLKTGDQLQIALEVLDAANKRPLWRDVFNVPAGNMVAMQAQTAARIRQGLAPVLGLSEFVADNPPQPKNEEAYRLFLRASALPTDPGPTKQAIDMLEKSVALDPAYAPAWVSLSARYTYDSWFGNGGEGAWRRATAALERAIALDPKNVGFRARTGPLLEQGEVAQAYREARDAVRERPDSALAHFMLSWALRFAGLLEESESECDAALLIDAQDSGARSCAVAFMLRGDYRRAMDYLHLDFGSEFSKALTMDVLLRQGKEKEALAARPPTVPQWAGYSMLLAFIEPKPAKEVEELARAVQPVHDPEMNYFSAAHLAYAGQASAAITMLKRTIQGGYCSYPAMDSDPLLASLRGQPEFAAIRSMGIECQKKFWAERGK